LRQFLQNETDRAVSELIAAVARVLDTHVLFKSWYIASFSTKGNLLSQWRAYCPRGGYSIGFDGARLTQVFRKRGEFQFGSVLYDRDAQEQKVRAVIEFHLALYRELRPKYPDV